MTNNEIRKFVEGVDVKEDGCWEWNKSRFTTGYGYISVGGKPTGAHRVAYMLFNGEIPKRTHIHHTCENPACVNPSHLVALTPRQHREAHKTTHCPNGHEYTDENTGYVNGTRVCKTCKRIAYKKWYDANRKAGPQTHCKRGHSLEDAYVGKDGRRHCRECHRERNRAYKQRKKEQSQ